jgi:Arc/MetJ-type ribon-helix-helix transcriptional regulator
MLKALVIRGEFSDKREVIRIALAETKKALRTKRADLEVHDFIPRSYGDIVVVQVKGCSGSPSREGLEHEAM